MNKWTVRAAIAAVGAAVALLALVVALVFWHMGGGAASSSSAPMKSDTAVSPESSRKSGSESGKVTVENPSSTPGTASESASAPPVRTPEFPLGKPLANKDVPNAVPPDLVAKIAAKAAADKWGKVAMGPPLECCDANGNILAYLWPAALNADTFPQYSAIMDMVKEGRSMGSTGKDAHGTSVSDVDAGKKEIGEGAFGTVMVSGRYDQFPVPGYNWYLPRYYYNGDKAAAVAAKALSANDVTLDRIYFLEGGHEQYFEFVWANQRVLVNSDSLLVRKPEEVLTALGESRMNAQDAAELANEWAQMTKGATQ